MQSKDVGRELSASVAIRLEFDAGEYNAAHIPFHLIANAYIPVHECAE